MAPDSGLTTQVRTARDAIAAHVRWKIRLQLAIAMREPLNGPTMQAVREPRECAIGKWLVSGATLAVRGRQEYKALVERHEEFHHEMLVIADQINAGDFDQARRGFMPGSTFLKAAYAISSAVTELDRIHPIEIPA